MVKAIIFDFGGVITPIEPWDGVDSTPEEKAIIRDAIADIAKIFASELKKSKFTADDFAREFKKRTGDVKEELVNRIIISLCMPNKELLDFISELSKTYKIYGLVNAPFGWTEIRRGVLGLDKYFERVFVSHEINVRKPDPKIFHYLLENTKIKPEECVFIDDKEANVNAAKDLGMQGYVFDGVDGLRGYLALVCL